MWSEFVPAHRTFCLITILVGLPGHIVSLVLDFIQMIPECYISPAPLALRLPLPDDFR